MARDRYKIFDIEQPHFSTSTIVNWLPIFSDPIIAQIILDSLRFSQSEQGLILYAYVIMENHLHIIASSNNLPKQLANFRSYTARQIIDYYKSRHNSLILNQLEFYKLRHRSDRTYQLWQEGTHPKQIQGEAMMRQKIGYIHNNPVKRGYVDDPLHWRYSSARNYAGLSGLLDVETDWL
ncbi:MAG: transposase [Chloroflexota bacterium]